MSKKRLLNVESDYGTTSHEPMRQPEPAVRQVEEIDREVAEKLGVAFSGGGIRSAAFCSGVLRRLLENEAEPDYLSCVSGGGYTGSAYVEWKYRKRDVDNRNWPESFFNHMRKNASYICDCQNCLCTGCCDFVILCALLFFVAILTPIFGWGSFAFPIAFVIKLLYGQFLDGTLCREKPDSADCMERNLLFSIFLVLFFLFHLLEYFCTSCCESNRKMIKCIKIIFKCCQFVSGATFAFTFLPWFINDFLRFSPEFIQVGIIVITAVFWFFVPLLRKYSSLVILIYSYSYVVYWHLFERKFFNLFNYTQERFKNCYFISLGILAVFSILGDVPLRLVHIYNRWRLQRAFYYYPKNPKICEKDCCYCYCYDIFPGGHCSSCCCTSCICPPEDSYSAEDSHRAVTLQDLGSAGIKPEYLSNMAVNGWRSKYDREYNLLTMSSKGISVIDRQPTESNKPGPSAAAAEARQQFRDVEDFRESCLNGKDFQDILKPGDIKLSSAMAMSAAALSPYLGKYKETEQAATHILTLMGLEMAASLVYDMKTERGPSKCHSCCLVFANAIILALILCGGGFLLWLFPESYTNGLPVFTTALVVIVGIVLLVLLIFICFYPCSPDDSLHKWSVVHLPIYRFLLSLVHFIHDGPKPPAMLHLSDGGHFENYGLLPLLKLRLPRILVADGSHIESDDDYGKEIIQVMEYAREILDCSFTAVDGGDVLNDLKNNYVKNKKQYFEFKVRYSDKGRPNFNGRRQRRGLEEDCAEGHIILIAPRSFNQENSFPNQMNAPDRGIPRHPDTWKLNSPITMEEIKKVSGFPAGLGCCDCWSSCSCSCCESCLAFPRHSTANQFFTRDMFTLYHRAGYKACKKIDRKY